VVNDLSNAAFKVLTLLSYPDWGPKNTLKAARLVLERNIELFTAASYIRPFSVESNEYKQAENKAQEICIDAKEQGLSIVSILDSDYPRRLSKIPDAPPVLYICGSVSVLNIPCIAIVGTRKPSDYGQEVAFRISCILASEGICIVSGLALGIDTAVHEGALQVKGKTVAVLAHGLDRIHPQRNSDLSEQIVAEGGALVSEHPPRTQIFRAEFIRRNRIQSGLSSCSLVVESGRTGGSIRQAEFTYKQGRDLFVVMPKHINKSNSDYDLSGSLFLMEKYDAKVIYDRDDLPLLKQCALSEI